LWPFFATDLVSQKLQKQISKWAEFRVIEKKVAVLAPGGTCGLQAPHSGSFHGRLIRGMIFRFVKS
jgi:hypothetical protein